MRKLSPEREINIRADSVLHQNDVGHQDTAPSLHLSKRGRRGEGEFTSGQVPTVVFKGTTFCTAGELTRALPDFCLLLQQIAKALGGPSQAFLVLNIPIWPLGTLGSGEVSVSYHYQALM